MTDIDITTPAPVTSNVTARPAVVVNAADQAGEVTVDVTRPQVSIAATDLAGEVPIIFPQPTDIFLYVTNIEYDTFDRVTRIDRSDGSRVDITYRAEGGISTVTKSRGAFTATLTAQYTGDRISGFVRT